MVATATMWTTGTPAVTASGAGTWATAANAAGANDAAFAGFTSVTTGEVATILCTGYGLDSGCLGMQIPVSVDSIVATVYFYVTGATGRWTSVTARLMDGATPLGSESGLTLSTTSSNSQALTFTGVAAWANLAAFGVLITGTKANTTSSVLNVDAIGVVMNYTPSAVTGNTYGGGSMLLQVG